MPSGGRPPYGLVHRPGTASDCDGSWHDRFVTLLPVRREDRTAHLVDPARIRVARPRLRRFVARVDPFTPPARAAHPEYPSAREHSPSSPSSPILAVGRGLHDEAVLFGKLVLLRVDHEVCQTVVIVPVPAAVSLEAPHLRRGNPFETIFRGVKFPPIKLCAINVGAFLARVRFQVLDAQCSVRPTKRLSAPSGASRPSMPLDNHHQWPARTSARLPYKVRRSEHGFHRAEGIVLPEVVAQ
jgi:hypothetical protein